MFIPMVGTVLTLFGVSYRRHVYPSNMILLGAFTVCESFLIGMVTSYMESRIVLQALILTSGVFVGLTLFTFQSKVSGCARQMLSLTGTKPSPFLPRSTISPRWDPCFQLVFGV